MSNLEKDAIKIKRKIITCAICGCKQYTSNYSRHTRTKKHKEADYADQKFEITKYEPPVNKKNDFLILR
jgi:hypothetical protein